MRIADGQREDRTLKQSLIQLVVMLLVLIVAASGVWLLTHRESDLITYESFRTMAAKIGCESTLSPAPYPGGATSAGQCALADGTVVDLRVYAGAGEGVAWLDGTRTRATAGKSIAVTGGPWVALVHSSDLMTGNSVVGPLTTP